MAKISKQKVLSLTLRIVFMVLFLVGMAMLLTWFIEYRFLSDDADQTWEFLTSHPDLYWYGFAIILSILTILSALLRPFLATGIVSAVVIGIMFANQYKYAVQHVPFLPEDFQMTGNVGNLTQFVDGDHLTRTIIVIILILSLSIFLTVLVWRRWHGDKQLPWWRRHVIIPRVILLIGGCVVLINLANALMQQANNAHRGEAAEWCGVTEFYDYDPVLNYTQLGFVSGFIYNLAGNQIDEPTGYDETALRTIAAKYNAKQQTGNADRTELKDKVDKIIVVLAESFYDPSLVAQYYPYSGGDITPALHNLEQTTPHGLMSSSVYGGGTANVEFEVDTGLTNYWERTTPFSTLLPYVNQIPAIANTAKSFGFQTATVHTFSGQLYKRSLSLPKEGFDDFFTDKDITNTQVNPGEPYINDVSAYREIFDRIKNNNDKQMFGLITMQNHAPYSRAYEQLNYMPLDDNGVPSQAPEEAITASYYQSLHYSDQALGDFITALKSLKQKTVVLWYGDHAGGVFNRVLTNENTSVQQLAYKTPYFIFTNFDLNTTNLQLPTTSPNCLTNTMYNILNVKKSALGYLLDDVCQDEPELTRVHLQDQNPKQTDAIKDYELVNYDILNGKQYWMQYANN